VRDKEMAQAGMGGGAGLFGDPAFKLVLLDEVNVALRKAMYPVEQVLDGIERRPANTHVVLTGRMPRMRSSSAQISLLRLTLVKTSAEAQ